MAPKLCDFLFLPFLAQNERILAKSVRQGGGVAAVVFQATVLEKLET